MMSLLRRHREIRRQMSHSHAIQGLTLKPDMLVDDNDITDREVRNYQDTFRLLFLFLYYRYSMCFMFDIETSCRQIEFHC
jgi:hypothetical protein